ncbi:SWIM zinc finger family protein [Streptomyces sp. NPDC004561]
MTDGERRPGDAARQALRTAQERTDMSGTPGEDGPDDPAGPEPRPADAARAALRAAVSARRAEDAPPTAETTPPARDEEAEHDPRPAPPAGRPADVAREALRAARREALRADPSEPRRATPGPERPGTPLAPGEAPSAARAKAAQEMRHYLANAFRMPSWPDTEQEETEPQSASAEPTATADGHATSADPAAAVGGHALSADPASAGDRDARAEWAAGTGGQAARTESAAASDDRAVPVEPSATAGDRVTPAESATSGRASSAESAAATGDRATGTEPSATTGDRATGTEPFATTGDRVTPTEPSPSSGDPTTPTEPSAAPDDRTAPHNRTPRITQPMPSHVPRTMGTPHRDGELRRTFPAFAARGRGEAAFAGSWWGNAWVDALEQGALDPKRLARGRGYADQGHVDAITVTPGLVLAYVRGSRPRPYRVQVRVRTLPDEDWARFLDAAADRPGHIAALLDKELPQSLADCGVPLLPRPGDLAPRCSCPDSGHPCKHAAALCYQTARLLDADPFVLLLLRGRGERELLDALSRRSAARAARAAQERQPESLPGVRAAEALAPRALPPLPPPSPVPPHPEQPPANPAAPGGPDPFTLDQLATDAAARAHALLGTGRDPVGELSLWQDAVRLAAARPGSGLTAATRTLYATLATAVGRTPSDLARAVAAWRQGGVEGLAVLEEPWDPPAGRFDRARPLLLAADLPAFRPWRNRLTHPRGHVQLRLGHDGLWYAYESEPGHDDWWPRGTPDLDPVGALTGLGTLDDA